MLPKIGETAGRIWELLSLNDSVPVADLPRSLNDKPVFVYQGLGWLAREGKVEFSERDGKAVVSLVSH